MKKSVVFLLILGLFVACNNQVTNKIDSNKCYMLQGCNVLGEPIESYACMMFERNAGRTFDEAFASVKPDLDLLAARIVDDEKGSSNYDADKWEIRQIVRKVKNAPDGNLTYTSIELYMFSKLYDAYTMVYPFCIIDSEGNLYHLDLPED